MSDRPKKILLICDNEIDIKVIQKLLEKVHDTNYKLSVYHSLAESNKLFSKKADAILLDFHLPDCPEEQMLEFIAQHKDAIPIIILSSSQDKEERIKAIQKGAQDFLIKNEFNGPFLNYAINNSIERHLLQKKLHQYARELEDKERKLVESQAIAQIGNWEFDPKNKKIHCSREALYMLRIQDNKNTLFLEEFLNLIHPDERKFVKEIFRQTIEEHSDFNEDLRLKLSARKIKHINLRVSAKAQEDGKIIGTIQDISLRKKIEAALISSEEKYHRLFEESRDAIYITTEEGQFIDFNNATVELFGYTEDELRNKPVGDLYFNPYEREKVKKEILKAGFVRDFELMLKRNDGTKIDCIITSAQWKSNDGKYSGFQGIIRDITEQKRTEELIRNKEIAERSSRLKQRFLANMSHEIRSPINAISGLTHLVLKTGLSDKQKEYITGIKTSSEHLLALVNDILDYTKIEEGKIKFESISFNLNEHLKEVVQTLHHAAINKGIELKTEFDPPIPVAVIGDPVKLNQIMINLLSNALKFTDKGFIKVKSKLVEDSENAVVVLLSVEDTGIGIPENKLETIFRSFTQLGRNITQVAEGTGLGLTITKQLVELQGGRISVKSKPNVGSTFEVVLKFRKQLLPGEQLKNHEKDIFQPEDIGYKKILIVEDKKLNQLVTSEMLKSWWRNIEVDVADDGQIAVEKTKEKNYDLILMDVQMPVMDGYEASRYIRNKMTPPASEVPILAMTAYNTNGEMEKCMRAGMNDFIPKPFEPRQLYEKVTGLIHPNTIPVKKNSNATPKDRDGKNEINFDYLNTVTGGNEDLKQKIIRMIIEETPAEIAALQKVTEDRNWNRVRAVVHKMKSTISYLGLMDTMDLAKKVEEYAATAQKQDTIPGMVEKICKDCMHGVNLLKAMQPNEVS